jgi:hypothetical protein
MSFILHEPDTLSDEEEISCSHGEESSILQRMRAIARIVRTTSSHVGTFYAADSYRLLSDKQERFDPTSSNISSTTASVGSPIKALEFVCKRCGHVFSMRRTRDMHENRCSQKK